MKKQLLKLFILTLSLVYGHTINAQCEGLFEADIAETFFTVNDDGVSGEFTISFRQTEEDADANVLIFGDPGVTFGPDSETELGRSTTIFGSSEVVLYQYACPDGTFPLEGLNVFVRFTPLSSCDTLTVTLPLETESSCGDNETDCSNFTLEEFVSLDFDLNNETGEFSWTGTAVEGPPAPYSSYNYNFTVLVDGEAVAGNGGSASNPDGSSLLSPFDGSVDVGITCVEGSLTCDDCAESPSLITVESTFTLGECTFEGTFNTPIDQAACSSGELTTTGDPRQVGNTIENLGDGRLTALSADGSILAFSSAGGYYIWVKLFL